MNLSIVKQEPKSQVIWYVFFGILGMVFLSIAKSCQSDNGFRVEHSARMGGGGVSFDTTYYEGGNRIIDHKVRNTTYRSVTNSNGLTAYLTFSDTTKKPIPQQKITVNRYELKGSDTLFLILLKQCSSPLDVTPRELNKIQTWLQTSIRQDTTAKN